MLLWRRLNGGVRGNTGGGCYRRVCAPSTSSQIVEAFWRDRGPGGEKNIEDDPPLPFDTLPLLVIDETNVNDQFPDVDIAADKLKPSLHITSLLISLTKAMDPLY
ncbi:Uncharacterized protein Fot_39316 [Forsythia ovata]|uniref:Uncharacterized protein n=1 Tax=Forsythia ovata TaxID=205694 RepID=A0ABD1S482_9LAMI